MFSDYSSPRAPLVSKALSDNDSSADLRGKHLSLEKYARNDAFSAGLVWTLSK